MLQMRKDRWKGNHWACIEFMPNDATYFLRMLEYLSHTYNFPFPHIVDLLDGYAADFSILSSPATLDTDSYMFSLAFADEAVRDQVFADLQTLPAYYFQPGNSDS